MSKRRRLVAPPPGRTAAALDRSRKSVRPVESIQADSELVALIVQKRRGSATPEPIVFQNAAGDWPARQWTPATFGSGRLGELQTELAFGRRRTAGDKLGVCWETGCDHQIGGLGQFVRWMNGESPTNFERWDPQSHWGYASYKRMHQLFAKTPEVLDEVQWERFGLPVAGAASNFWFGSEGTSTPCHLDSYGSNLIAQLHGRKKWTLFPPEQTDCLYPTRLPYEESSVFSRVDLVDPDTDVHPRFQNAAPYEVVLNPGDVLFVPRHWWHYVEALDTAISVNLWLTHPADPAARVSEALVRLLVSELKREPVVRAPSISPAQTDPSRNLWLNPGEVRADYPCAICLLSCIFSATCVRLGNRCSRLVVDFSGLACRFASARLTISSY